MARTNAARNSSNHLLASLPQKERKSLEPKLKKKSLPLKEVLYEPDSTIENVYFPSSGVVSLVSEMDEGTVEIATIGREGFVGLPVFLGSDTATIKALSQIPGDGMIIKTRDFKTAIKNSAALRRLLQYYTQALINQIAQSAACNRAHSIEQRCARWLLMTHDRVDEDNFFLTQEFLGQMLGVRRPQVSKVANSFQKAGMIQYVRGQISISNRRRLESIACECYEIVKKEYQRLLGES